MRNSNITFAQIKKIGKSSELDITTSLSHINFYLLLTNSYNFQKYGIIHSSGLVLISGKKYFECYLDLFLDDEKYKDLKILLDKNKSKFKDIKLEELSLCKSKVNLNGYMEN